MSAERRQIKRRHLIYYLMVVDAETDQKIGFLVDITTSGIMMMTDAPVAIGSVREMKMFVRSELSSCDSLQFRAECRWCEKSPNGVSYDAGFRLLDVPADMFQDIEQIIAEIGFND